MDGDHSDALQIALTELARGLIQGKQMYCGGTTGAEQREGVKASLAAVLAFLHGFPEVAELDLDLPLGVLGRALVGLDRGYVEPLLERTPPDTRPERIDLNLLRGYSAAAAEILRPSLGLDEACKKVAKRLKDAGFRLPSDRAGGRAITAKTINGWRRKARNGSGDSSLWLLYKKATAADNILDASAAAEELLGMLARWRPPNSAL
jgi:hypothetical protein